jgi:hypothetical protein
MARAPRAAAATPAAAPAEPPAPAPAPAPELSVPDQFDVAFAEAAAAEVVPTLSVTPIPPATPATPAPTDVAPKKPAEPAPEPKPAVEPQPEVPQPQSPTGEPLPPQPLERSPQPQPQNLPPQPPPQVAQPEAYAPQPQAPQEPPLFSAEEVTQLQTFYTEWPDVARATEVMIRGIMGQTARRMYADMAASLAPYLQTIDTLADRSQLSELQGQVPDYETVSTQLTTWAARQPAYLRSAYEHVIKAGTAAEVVDLINRYKQDMQSTTPAQGGQPAPAAPVAAQAPAPAPAPVNPALAAAAARLAPVSTKRTNVVAPPADFDTAFAEFARAS